MVVIGAKDVVAPHFQCIYLPIRRRIRRRIDNTRDHRSLTLNFMLILSLDMIFGVAGVVTICAKLKRTSEKISNVWSNLGERQVRLEAMLLSFRMRHLWKTQLRYADLAKADVRAQWILKLVSRGFLRVLRFPPLLHRFNGSANKIRLK